MRYAPKHFRFGLVIRELESNTPALVGKTASIESAASLRRKHPRGCGEDRNGRAGQTFI